jgi:ADP-heptose:LPS heptosyltransferase
MDAPILFYSVDNVGDLLCTTPTVRAFRRQCPDAFLAYVTHNAEYCRLLDGNPDLDLVLHREDLSIHGDGIVDEGWLRRLPLPANEAPRLCRFDVQAIHRADPTVFRDHISWAFARRHGVSLDSVRPTLVLSSEERERAAKLVRRPYIVVGMHTKTPVRGGDGELTRKDWVFERWLDLAQRIDARGQFDIVAVGSAGDLQVQSRYFRNLYGLPIKLVAAVLEQAACVVTVEGGLSHICHALDAPMVLIFSKFVSYPWAYPREATRCRAIYDDPRSISSDDVLAEIDALISDARAGRAAPPPGRGSSASSDTRRRGSGPLPRPCRSAESTSGCR